MIELRQTVTVPWDIRTVFRYVSDWSNIAQWDPGVRRSAMTTPGPVRPGSAFALTCGFYGVAYPMTYRVAAFEAPVRVVLQGQGKTVAATDVIDFREIDGGTRIDYTLRLDDAALHPMTRMLVKRAVGTIARKAMKGLQQAFAADRRIPGIRPLDRILDRTVLPGMLTFSRYGYLWRQTRFDPLVESLVDRTVLVTGATSGIGRAAAAACARLGATVIVVGRTARKVDSVCREIAAETGNPEIHGRVADLSLKSQIRRLAREIDDGFAHLHVLINNAGALFDRRAETAEGIERSLAVNLAGPFLLTGLLQPKLRASAPSRIVNVSSGGMYTQKLPVTDLGCEQTPYQGEKAYARAKRGVVVLTEMWADRWANQGIAVHAMHPGWVDTPGIRKSLPRFTERLRPILRTPAQGADTIVWLAAAGQAARAGGRFWLDRRPHVTHVFPATRESAWERMEFLKKLETIAGIEMTDG